MSGNDDDSKSSFGNFLFGENGMFAEFSDNQRLERLKQCASIEKSMRVCEEIHQKVEKAESGKNTESKKSSSWWPKRAKQAESKKADESTDKINEISAGEINSSKESRMDMQTTKTEIKIARFYNWNDEDKDDPKRTNGNSLNSVNNEHCIKKTHAVWACRALALGCASDLVLLKECFQQNNRRRQVDILNEDTKKNDDACQRAQMRLSKCVDIQASALNQRIKKRRENTNKKL